jgi:hypothetical protein
MADRERKRTRQAAAPRGSRSPKPALRDAGEPMGEPRTPSHDEIAHRAWELYLARGQTDGRDIDDWLQAEQELSSRPPGPPTAGG